jgi:hypothetical protein
MKSPTKHKEGIVAVLDALGAAAYGETEISRFMRSRAIVLTLARHKAKDMLDVKRLKVFTFNDTIVFALERAASPVLVKCRATNRQRQRSDGVCLPKQDSCLEASG